MNNFKRRALIVSSWLRGDTRDFRNGVREDVSKIKGFLASGNGGCFLDQEEICHLHRPSVLVLEQARAWLSEADYGFVYYSGHGLSIRQEALIALREGLPYRVGALANLAPRQVTIVDTCRNEVGSFSSFLGVGDPSGDIDWVPWAFSREAFASLMSAQPMGRVLIQSSGYDQASYSTENGGIFTTALMDAVERFRENARYGVLTTTGAFGLARREMADVAEHGQRPMMRWTRSLGDAGLMLAIQPEVVWGRWMGRVG